MKPSYLAPVRADGRLLKSKIVDFAIVLEPSPTTAAGFKNLDPLDQASTASYNQTTDNTAITRPLAVNIETKEAGGDFNEAVMQLAVWTSAQYARLKRLAATAGTLQDGILQLPVLPVLIVQGSTWTLGAASHDAGGTVRSPLSLFHHIILKALALQTLWQMFPIGSSNEILGLYKIVAALHRLMAWAETEYRPWFEANMVPLTPYQKAALPNSGHVGG